MTTKALGDLGEAFVCDLLIANGWQIVAQSDLDIVASDRTNLIFIEVKTRSGHNWDQDGLLAITPVKQQKLWRAAQSFLAQHESQFGDRCCRFDVALVRHQSGMLELKTYLENAFSVA
jgi:putative endonuclease